MIQVQTERNEWSLMYLDDEDEENIEVVLLDSNDEEYRIKANGEEAEKLVVAYRENDEVEYLVTVLFAPEGEGDDVKLSEIIVAWKVNN